MAGPEGWVPWDALPQVLEELQTCRITREELEETASLVELLAATGGPAAGSDLPELRPGRPRPDDRPDHAPDPEAGNEHPCGFAVFSTAFGGAGIPLHARCLAWRGFKLRSVWVFFVVCVRGPRARFIGATTTLAFAARQDAWLLAMAVRARPACP